MVVEFINDSACVWDPHRLSGFNLYATVLTLGLLQRFNLVLIASDLYFISHEWVIGIAAVLYLIEFLAQEPRWSIPSGTRSKSGAAYEYLPEHGSKT